MYVKKRLAKMFQVSGVVLFRSNGSWCIAKLNTDREFSNCSFITGKILRLFEVMPRSLSEEEIEKVYVRAIIELELL